MKTLEELQAEDLPRCQMISEDWETPPPEGVLDHEHWSQYLGPDTRECPMCGRPVAALSWALVHGEMVCPCGYPATAYHFIDGNRYVVFLYVHPSELSRSTT